MGMRSRLLLSLLLIGGWVWALVDDLPQDWLVAWGTATLVLPLSLLPLAWKWRKKNPPEESSNERQREKREVKAEETKSRVTFAPPEPEPDPAWPSSVGWKVAVEEERDEELSLLVLQDFYATQVYKGRREPPHAHCDMVTGLVDSLLRKVQTFGPCCEAVFQGRCVGVGSMFEGWGVSRGDQVPVYDVMVVIHPPVGFSLDVELGQGEQTAISPPPPPPSTSTTTPLSPPPSPSSTAPLSPATPSSSSAPPTPSTLPNPPLSTLPSTSSTPPTPPPPPSKETDSGSSSPQHPLPTMQCGRGMARVMVRAEAATPRRGGRSFSSRYLLHQFLERAHMERSKEGLNYMLEECLMVDQYMEPVRLLAWLGAGLRRAWAFRGGVKLSFWGPDWPCVMRVESVALGGRVLYINVVPAVRLADSDVCVVARGAASPPWAEFWEPWFCSDESYFLRCSTRRLPGNSCHLMLLELLAFLSRPPSPAFSARGVSFLASYHLKTVLLHLLLLHREPQAWDAACLVPRLRDALGFLLRCLGDKHLPSFWVGNEALGDLQPPPFRQAPPLNLFAPLAQHKGWYGLALLEFNRLRARLHDLPCGPPGSHTPLGPRDALSTERVASGHLLAVKQQSALGHYRSLKLPPSLKGVIARRLTLGGGGQRGAMVAPHGPLLRGSTHGLRF